MTTGSQDTGAQNPFLDELRDLQKYAAQFQSMISTARNAAPSRASGYDTSGLAFAEVDRDGQPTTLRIEQGWRNALEPAQLGAAIIEAYQTATQTHLEEWGADLKRQGWQYDAREFDELVSAAPTPSESLFAVPRTVGEPRPVEALLSAVIDELDFSHVLATQPPAPAREPAAPHSRVSVTLTNGALESVHIDADWAEGRQSSTINSELAGALQAARLRPTPEQSPAHGEHTARLDDLLGEVMKALQNHRLER